MTDLTFLESACVFGSGAFGTCLATVLARKSKKVNVWHVDANESRLINEKQENIFFLKGVPLLPHIYYTANVKEAISKAQIILFVIPTQFLRSFLKENASIIREHVKATGASLIMCSKGIEKKTLKFPGQILEEFFPEFPVSVLAGPSFAKEVAMQLYTNVCIANKDIKRSREQIHILTTPDRMFRCWASTDTIGCEVSSAVKNVLAIASGMLKGLGMGLNARATLISRGILEIRDLTLALGGTGESIFGLAGLGDLLLTCSSEMSRNFSVGLGLGKGKSLESTRKAGKGVAEGVSTAEPLSQLAAKYNVSMPICNAVFNIIYNGDDVRASFNRLSAMPLLDEGLPPLSLKPVESKL